MKQLGSGLIDCSPPDRGFVDGTVRKARPSSGTPKSGGDRGVTP